MARGLGLEILIIRLILGHIIHITGTIIQIIGLMIFALGRGPLAMALALVTYVIFLS